MALRDYQQVVRRWKWVIFPAVIVAIAISAGISIVQDTLYQGTARVLLQPREGEALFDAPSGQPLNPARTLETELDLVKHLPPPDDVAGERPRIAGVAATADENTDIIKVNVRSPDRQLAARAANAYANAYIESRRLRTVEGLQAVGRQLEGKVVDLEVQINALGRPASGISDPLRESLVERQSALKEKLDEVQVEASVTTGGTQLAAPAEVPTSPVQPQPLRNGVLAGALGLGLGLGCAFLFDQLDDRIMSREQLDPLIPDIPILGIVPMARGGTRKEPRPIVLSAPDAPAAEAFRSLRTSLQFLGIGQQSRILQVTSPNVGEGKTTILANLAVAFSQAGQRVAVVSCDLRRPFLHRIFGLDNSVGFTTVVRDPAELKDAMQTVRGAQGLSLLASGPPLPNPSEVLSYRTAEKVFVTLRDMVDVVLVDSPPLLPVTDAAVLIEKVDAVLLVVASGLTRKRHLHRSLEILKQLKAPVIGMALNRVGDQDGYGDYSHYRSSEKASRWRRRAPQ